MHGVFLRNALAGPTSCLARGIATRMAVSSLGVSS